MCKERMLLLALLQRGRERRMHQKMLPRIEMVHAALTPDDSTSTSYAVLRAFVGDRIVARRRLLKTHLLESELRRGLWL